MLKTIYVNGYKSIKELEVECSRLNLFIGTNSSGKSSLLQAILLVVQNLERSYGLNGPLVSSGEFRETRNYSLKNDTIEIKLSNEEKERVDLTICEDGKAYIEPREDGKLARTLNLVNRRVHFLSCSRIGSRDVYNKNLSVSDMFGKNGEYAIDFLSKYKDEPLEKELICYHESYTLSTQVNRWLEYIIGARIQTEEIIGTDVVKASYNMVESFYARPKNVGSGVSYLISILIVCLGSHKGDMIIIENPEIHLHPLSQSRLCEFLYFISKADRQVFVETHSDHLFDAIRVGISQRTMEKEHIAINFFRLGSDGCTRKHVIDIGKNGRIENPMPNLFDQFEVDLNKMLGL